jgi:acyl-coenzyme A synthetase/AMP-(fatty) acid ligase
LMTMWDGVSASFVHLVAERIVCYTMGLMFWCTGDHRYLVSMWFRMYSHTCRGCSVIL